MNRLPHQHHGQLSLLHTRQSCPSILGLVPIGYPYTLRSPP